MLTFLLVATVAAVVVWTHVLDQHSLRAKPTATCPSVPAISSIGIRVYNSTQRTGIAGDASALLRARGFDVLATGNDPTSRRVRGTAQIRYGAAGKDAASIVAAAVPGATLVADGRAGQTVDVALGPAYRSVASAAAITAEHRALQKRDHCS